jgi:hypothetical protein
MGGDLGTEDIDEVFTCDDTNRLADSVDDDDATHTVAFHDARDFDECR